MVDPNTIYNYYTSFGIDELHRLLLKDPIHLPGNNGMYIEFLGEMNSYIVLRNPKIKDHVLLYLLTTEIINTALCLVYKQIRTAYTYIPLGWPLVYTPREAFIRRYLIWIDFKDINLNQVINKFVKDGENVGIKD